MDTEPKDESGVDMMVQVDPGGDIVSKMDSVPKDEIGDHRMVELREGLARDTPAAPARGSEMDPVPKEMAGGTQVVSAGNNVSKGVESRGKKSKSAEESIMDILAQFHENGRTVEKETVLKLTGIAPKTLSNTLPKLKRKEFVDYETTTLRLTAAGAEKMGLAARPVASNEVVHEPFQEDTKATGKSLFEQETKYEIPSREPEDIVMEEALPKDSAECVQVIENPPESIRKRSRTLEEVLERRKRRKRLRRMLREAGEFPSFVALIAKENEKDKEEGKKDKTPGPDVVIIDVDEYLGLSSDNKESDRRVTRSSSHLPNPDSAASGKVAASTPAEEGYYVGRVGLTQPEDNEYLTTLQQLIRSNLEFFSATATDAAGSQAGRRYPIVEGKVGIRCIHCAKVGLEYEARMAAKIADAPVEPDKSGSTATGEHENKTNDDSKAEFDSKPKEIDPSKIWPPGSISYPLNVSGLYSICSQKPQLHFESCPNLPPTCMAQLYRHMKENAFKAGEIRVKSREVPAAMYYTVAAKRIGLVNVPGGLRFGRDLTLEPLPLEAVLAQEMQESEEEKVLIPPPILPDQLSSAPNSARSTGSRFAADSTSEQVLQEALAEADDRPNHLARAEDKKMVSDYIFLIIRQMSVCRAVPADFATRGKKTKKMRIGFAGFCCRHCLKVREESDGNELARAHGASGYSCRSFSSEADTLASAVSNSFAEHLAKCWNVPKRIRFALAVYKRIHPDQMAELPYGSQRKKFEDIWNRLRVADIDEAEMNRRIRTYKPGEPDLPAIINTDSKEPSRPKPAHVKPEKKKARLSPSKSKQMGRDGADFPRSKSSETKRILALAQENWDRSTSGENGGMVVPSDIELVSDYVFLCTRNLKVAMPTVADVAKGRRGPATQTIIAGMCCMHCDGKDPSMIAPSCRSFPTAPDNYASAFNTSLYNHMQRCHFIKEDVKRALADLRKLHSQQIAHLMIGAQRRFFGLLCNRLKRVPIKGKLPPGPAKAPSPAPRRASRSSNNKKSGGSSRSRSTRGGGDDAILSQFRFFEAPLQSFFCLRCRMVPLQFRARGSLSFAKPTLDFMSEHHEACKEDGFDLWFCVESLKEVLNQGKLDVAALLHPLFREVILECFGQNEQLATIFTSEIVKVYQMSKHGGVTQAVENYVKAKSQGLWGQLPSTVDTAKVLHAFEKFAATVEGLSPNLTDHDTLVKYLLLICPTLRLSHEEDSEEDEEAADDEDETERRSEDNENEAELVATKPAARKVGKELRKKKKTEEEEGEENGGDDSDEVEVIKVPARRRGKELRRKRTEDEEEDEKELGGGDDEDEVISITPRKPRGGKELRRKRATNRPVYTEHDDDEDESLEGELEDDDEDENAEVESEQEDLPAEDESAQGSNGDVFEDEGLPGIDVEGTEEHSDPDELMREGINEDLEGEVSREQMELDELH